MHFGSITITKVIAAAVLLLAATACRKGPPRAPALGEAFVGPAVLKIRSDIPTQSPTVATAKHGDRLEILARRRRFLRVRTPSGAEGWTDERQLLAAEDMAALRQLKERAATMTAQGQATTFGDLNVHTQPVRSSPSFIQIKENEKVDVLTHAWTPRADVPRKPLLPPTPKAAKKLKTGPKREPKYPPPPMPKPPSPPPDWLELSKTDLPEEADEPEDANAAPVPQDDWSLVRTHSGQSGWVLTRRLIMAIPDEVAQYAEGKRIVSYFPLGEIPDGDQKKHIWLWTTVTDGMHPWDFESFRVFIWSLKRHRYETAYIERNLRGYAPVLLEQVDFALGPKGRAETAKYPGFSICVEKSDGKRYRREYALLGNIIRFAGERPCEAPAVETVHAPAPLPVAETPAPAPTESFAERVKRRLKALTHGRTGG
ncbi:MAG TPA: hypothetical protein VGF59_17385 [Bryobacteraceae bacterium]